MKEEVKIGGVVLVTWLDSAEDHGWKNRSALDAVPGAVRSVGFVAAVSDSALVLSHSQGVDPAGRGGTLSAVVIPWAAIVECHEVTLPKPPIQLTGLVFAAG